MGPRLIASSLDRAAGRIPGLRRIPLLKLLSIAEVALLTRDHVRRLTPEERRRVIELVRIGRGRRRNLSEPEHQELATLVAKLEPRLLAGTAVDKLSPMPLPTRLVRGRKERAGLAAGSRRRSGGGRQAS